MGDRGITYDFELTNILDSLHEDQIKEFCAEDEVKNLFIDSEVPACEDKADLTNGMGTSEWTDDFKEKLIDLFYS